MKKLAVPNLGAIGVRTTDNPLSQSDGTLTKSQNALPGQVPGDSPGLETRPGLVEVTPTAASGAISSLYPFNFGATSPVPKVPSLLVAVEDASNPWMTSLNGTTWANVPVATIARAQSESKLGTLAGPITCNQGAVWYKGALHYISDGYTLGASAPTVRKWDGSTDTLVFTIPPNPTSGITYPQAVTALCIHAGYLMVAVMESAFDTASPYGRVFCWDGTTLWPFCNRFGLAGTSTVNLGIPFALVSNGCSLFVGMQKWQDEGRVLQSRAAFELGIDSTSFAWLLVAPFASTYNDELVTGVILYKGDLYFTTWVWTSGAGITPKVYCLSLTATGLVTTSLTGPASTTNSYFCPLAVYGGNLYVGAYNQGTGALEIKKFDGATWTTDLTVSAHAALARFGNAVECNSDLYVVVAQNDGAGTAGTICRLHSGAWTYVNDAKNFRGFIAVNPG